jgi:DNA invertase Pin-like site-specific DNA recombinase
MTKEYVAYYRVSTQKQGASGLGLDAQRAAVQQFCSHETAKLVAEYTEIESGKRADRPELLRAIEYAKTNTATLLIAKLDRLSRNAAFILTLRDSGVQFVCADMPDANTLTIGIFAVLAEYERELIARRTKSALQIAKQRGTKLGTPANLTPQARQKGLELRKHNALTKNAQARELARLYREKGMTLAVIATRLNEQG